MLVYAPIITPRIEYIFHYLREKTGIAFELTESNERYQQELQPKINYSLESLSLDDVHIIPCGLLSESGICSWEIKVIQHRDFPIFFANGGTLGFDLPAAVFYLISRYEEYHPFTPDEYGRYPCQNSLAYQAEFLNTPLVDEWVNHFTQQLKSRFPTLQFKYPEYNFIPTYDIDIAWSYLHKGWIRNIGGFFKYPKTAIERLRVLIGLQKDPFDCYDELHQIHKHNDLKPIYFFPVGCKRSSLDKHISPDNKAYRRLIQSISTKAEIGLHPSVYSNEHLEAVAEEKTTLEEIIGRPVHQSRQHYLLFTLPDTYRTLIKAGITDDYSMGYGTVNGFRASTSQSFLWYDLEREETTPLRIHPLAWMDANAYYEQKLDSDDASAELKYYHQTIQKVNGHFISVSHNHLIAAQNSWKRWPEQYKKFLGIK
jgi:hypothetical protein